MKRHNISLTEAELEILSYLTSKYNTNARSICEADAHIHLDSVSKKLRDAQETTVSEYTEKELLDMVFEGLIG